MIYLDANPRLTTWQAIANTGGYPLYEGRAEREDIIIRWGCNHSRYAGRYPEGVKVLNPRLILSKIQQSVLFLENDVPTPKTFQTILQWERAGCPELVVKRDIGQMGIGITRTTHPRFYHDKLYQIFIDKDREFRAMMVGNIAAFFHEKMPPQDQNFRWNFHRGAEWTRIPEERGLRGKLKTVGYKALKALDYDFAAVDIIVKGDELYVLECNSRPEFGRINAEHFVRALEIYLDRGEE